ncbi:unnamed protein product [Cuscuta epithymum]|uniref:Uncharacterized protein n=1 Tax=Cuscuta epithymum TaxID=186058 RepID=A0AAV0CGP5_9ASTE|nr:unnamed protein product [Cuscuta epithymum]
MAMQISPNTSTPVFSSVNHLSATKVPIQSIVCKVLELGKRCSRKFAVGCSEKQAHNTFRTCKRCKNQFDPLLNHHGACRYHTAHFGGETKRKFESVYSGGSMNTPDSGKITQYWHCCGSEDIFHPGCTPTSHASYDDS